MVILLKTGIVVFLIAWTFLGVWLVVRYGMLFGPNPEHGDETPGARSFGIAHIVAVWVGSFALALYFLFL